MNGYQCPNCGEWIYGNTHTCKMLQQPLVYPSTIQQGHRTYKCPCGGEFDYIVTKKMMIKGFNEEVSVCPFCGKRMKGK